MQSNIVICIIILSSIAFVILAWIFFSRRRAEFKHALLVTHNSNQCQTPPQLQTRDLITESRPSVPAQLSSNSSDDSVVEIKRARAKAKAKAKVQRQMDKTRKMTGGIGHVEEPPVTVKNEDKTGEPTSKAQPETEGSGKGTTPAAAASAAPVDPVDGDWGDTVNTTQKGSHGGWGEENANTDATSNW